MNAIKLIHLNIWRRFRTRLLSTFLYYGGFLILGWADWRLARVVLIDKSGRPPKPKVSPESIWLLERAAALGTVTKGPEPLLLGRHLVALGLKPGPHFGPILQGALEKQLDGDILDLDTALEYARVAVAQIQST